jgi:predicted nucleic acid-binding protein
MQELLFGVRSLEARSRIVDRFTSLKYLTARLDDHVAAAELNWDLRLAGVQVGAADALIAQLAIANDLTLLTTDRDFEHAAKHIPLKVWRAPQT